MARIEDITAEVEAGVTYKGSDPRLADFGAFVLPLAATKEGLVHISQIAEERVEMCSRLSICRSRSNG